MMTSECVTAGELPRVLVVTSNNFNLQGGGGITLTNLFRGWPADRLASLHEDSTPPDLAVCPQSFQLTRREVRWIRPFSLLQSWTRPGDADAPTGALAVDARQQSLKRRLVGDGLPRDVTLSPELFAWIDRFQPQLAYGFLGSLAQIRLMRRIADRWRVPLAVHIMDDWPSVIYTSGLLAPMFRPLVLREFADVLRRASAWLAISDLMAAEYSQRYGYPFTAFHNAVDTAEWARDQRRSWGVNEHAEVRYVGSVLPEAQRDALHDICDAVVRLRHEGIDVRLSIHAPASQGHALRQWGYPGDVLDVQGPPDPAAVPRLLASADVVVLPFNFDADSRRYIRLSMPTKVPAYMASGTPILAYGPEDVAAMRYAKESGWALTVSEQGVASVQTGLRCLLTDVALRQRIAGRAIELARQNHDIGRVRDAFWRTLTAAAAVDRDALAPAGEVAR